MFDNTENNIKEYKKSNLLGTKYYFLLNDIGKIINNFEIDISSINKSIINKINAYHRLRTLNKPCFTEPEDDISEDEINSDYNEDDELNSDYGEDDEINSDYDEYDQIINKSNEEKTIIKDEDHINDLHIILREAMKSNDRDLMTCTINLLRELESNKNKINIIYTVNNQENEKNTIDSQENNINTASTYFKTPEWIVPFKCTINHENNKKLGNKSFNYAVATSKTSGKNRTRLTSIEKFMNDFNFNDINYPLEKKDYETFENNNSSTKLLVLKAIENEEKLIIHYNQTENNDRENKIDLILLRNNHYIYITKYSSLSRYIKYN